MKKIAVTVVACILAGCASHRLRSSSTTSETELIAAVAGYQVSRTLETGEKVPLFSPAEEAKDVCTDGILFYVLAPTNYAGKFFWMVNDQILGVPSPAEMYDSSRRYRFKLSTELRNCKTVHPNDLMSIMPHSFRLCLCSRAGDIYFATREEIDRCLDSLETERKAIETELLVLSNRLAVAEGPSDEAGVKQSRAQIDRLHWRLGRNRARRYEVENLSKKARWQKEEEWPKLRN